jgi:hypothetical protein
MTQSGEARRVVWNGMGRVLATRGRRDAATPVIVRKGVLGDNAPHNDLRVTKAHSLFIDGFRWNSRRTIARSCGMIMRKK